MEIKRQNIQLCLSPLIVSILGLEWESQPMFEKRVLEYGKEVIMIIIKHCSQILGLFHSKAPNICWVLNLTHFEQICFFLYQPVWKHQLRMTTLRAQMHSWIVFHFIISNFFMQSRFYTSFIKDGWQVSAVKVFI